MDNVPIKIATKSWGWSVSIAIFTLAWISYTGKVIIIIFLNLLYLWVLELSVVILILPGYCSLARLHFNVPVVN